MYMATVLLRYEDKNNRKRHNKFDGFGGIVGLPYKLPMINTREDYDKAQVNMVTNDLMPWMMEQAKEYMPDDPNFVVSKLVLNKLEPMFVDIEEVKGHDLRSTNLDTEIPNKY